VGAHNFRRLAQGHVLVAGAGPVSNLILAVMFTIAYGITRSVGVGVEFQVPIFMLIRNGILMNVALAVFNLVPLPPLDGSWIASWGLPRSIANHYDRIVEPYGQWILLILFATGILGIVIAPFISLVLALLNWFVH
jgi:Zn-dependent protease